MPSDSILIHEQKNKEIERVLSDQLRNNCKLEVRSMVVCSQLPLDHIDFLTLIRDSSLLWNITNEERNINCTTSIKLDGKNRYNKPRKASISILKNGKIIINGIKSNKEGHKVFGEILNDFIGMGLI